MKCPLCQKSDCRIFPEWSDEETMDFYFSLPQSENNDDMLAYWSRCTIHFCEYTYKMIITPDDIKNAFERQDCFALCLPETFLMMERMDSLKRLRDILCTEETQAQSLLSQLANLTLMPLTFTLRMLAPVSWKTDSKTKKCDESEQFVLTDIVAEVSDAVAAYFKNLCPEECLVWIQHVSNEKSVDDKPPDSLGPLCKWLSQKERILKLKGYLANIEKDECEIIATHLVSTNRAVRLGDIIRVGESKNALSEGETGLLRLRFVIKKLKKHVDDLKLSSDCKKKNAVQAKREGNVQLALSYLKRSKIDEEAQEKRCNELLTFEKLYHQLESALLNKELFDAQSNTLKALQASNDQISVQKAEKIWDEIQNEIDEVKDMSELLTTPHTEDSDTEALERELQKMLAELRNEEHPAPAAKTSSSIHQTKIDKKAQRPPVQPAVTMPEANERTRIAETS